MPHGPHTPENESRRLARIRDYALLDRQHDPVFDHIAAIASHQLQSTYAIIAILDENGQYFRARCGEGLEEMPRHQAFCSYAIETRELFQVTDARRDPRFRENPQVTGAPGLRFYAGVPLITEDGLALGTLAILDIQPRGELAPHQADALRMLAGLVMDRIRTLRERSFIDGPTGLYNRQRLEADVSARQAAGERLLVAVADVLAPLFLNELTKALGFGFADSLVLSIRDRLRAALPAGTPLYRISPTRFGFVLADEHLPRPDQLFERVVQQFRTPVGTAQIPIHAEVGVGVLRLVGQAAAANDWLRSVISTADEARTHGSGWAWYDPQSDRAQQRAFTVLSSLSEAVNSDDGQLRLFFQPRVDLATGACTSVEALLRWQHPTLGPVGPAEFIPLAEKTALMRPLSRWVLRQAIAQRAQWQAQGHVFRVAINVSAVDLESAQFTAEMLRLLEAEGLDPHCLELEFTESALMRSPDLVRQQLERIRTLGVEVAIDDFGSGYSNWTYLRALPASSVKLDRSLLGDLSAPADQRLVRTIIELGRELGYRVVAEGIETAEMQRLMTEWGCHEGQGYLFARPMPASDLPGWLAARGGR